MYGQDTLFYKNPYGYFKLGEKYTQEDIDYVLRDVNHQCFPLEFNTLKFVFFTDNFSDQKQRSCLVTFQFKNDVLVSICLEYIARNGFVKKDYINAKEKLKNWDNLKTCKTPEQLKKKWNKDSNSEYYSAQFKDNPNVCINIEGPKKNNPNLERYCIRYELIDASIAELKIQDSFFGLTLGKKYATSIVKSTITNGEYVETINEKGNKTLAYANVWFGGYQWDFAFFDFTNKNKFLKITFTNIRFDSLQEEKETNTHFDSILEKLQNKYGYKKTEHENNDKEYLMYYGDNEILCKLEKGKFTNKEGQKSRYLNLTYTDIKEFKLQIEQEKKEF